MIIIFSPLVVMLLSFISGRWVMREIIIFFSSFLLIIRCLGSSSCVEVLSSLLFVDKISFILVSLSFFVGGLILSASYTRVKFVKKFSTLFVFLSFFITLMLLFSFLRINLLYFYIYFEVVLIPIFLLVIGWGYQPERVQAGVYILFYTLFASLPLLLIILIICKDRGTLERFEGINLKRSFGAVVSFLFIFAFLVKLPMFCVHLWLPKAHVEAPVAGSIILAALLLKLGGYGLWRIFSWVKYTIVRLLPSIIMLGLLGGVIVRFVCFVQVDIKSLVAYSSVVHIGILLSGVMTAVLIGFDGALMMMVGHGFISSGLFFMVGCIYDRSGTRSLLLNKGLIIVFPRFTVLWFLLRIFNIRAPPSLNLLREILLTTRVLAWRWKTAFYLMVINFMGMVFTFYLYAQSQQGKSFERLASYPLVFIREYMVGVSHVILLLGLTLTFWLFYLNSLIKIQNCDFCDAFSSFR